jgi:hypothetical protein
MDSPNPIKPFGLLIHLLASAREWGDVVEIYTAYSRRQADCSEFGGSGDGWILALYRRSQLMAAWLFLNCR